MLPPTMYVRFCQVWKGEKRQSIIYGQIFFLKTILLSLCLRIAAANSGHVPSFQSFVDYLWVEIRKCSAHSHVMENKLAWMDLLQNRVESYLCSRYNDNESPQPKRWKCPKCSFWKILNMTITWIAVARRSTRWFGKPLSVFVATDYTLKDSSNIKTVS